MNAGARACARMGHQLGRGTAARRVSSFAIALATFCLVTAFCLASVIIGVREERALRDAHRTSVAAMTGGDLTATGPRWRPFADSVDDRWVDVIVIVPERGGALPPGLEAWPEPGDVVLPPALKGTPAGARLAARYGNEASETIGRDGLLSPAERIAYWRPAITLEPTVHGYPLEAFDTSSDPDPFVPQGGIGGTAYQRSLDLVLISYAVLVTLPCLVFLVVAARIGSARRMRALSLLHVSGASPCHVGAFLAGALGRSMLAGIAGSALFAAILALIDVRVPGTGFILEARDVAAHMVRHTAFMGGASAVAVTIALALNWPRRARGTRPRPRERVPSAWRALFLPVSVAAGYLALGGTDQWGMGDARVLLIYLSAGVVAATLPPFFSAGIRQISRLMALAGHRRAIPALTVAGRQLLAAPRVTRRLCAGMAILVFLAVAGTLLTTHDDPAAAEALAARDTIANRGFLLYRMYPQMPLTGEVAQAMPRNSAWASAQMSEDGDVVLTAPCAALHAFDLPCAAARVDPRHDGNELFHSLVVPTLAAPDTVTVHIGEPIGAAEDQLFLVSTDGAALPREALMRSLGHLTAPPMLLETSAESWIVGLRDTEDQQRWTVLMTSAAAVVLALAVICAALGDAAQESHTIGVLRMWGADRRFAARVALLRVMLPLVFALLCGFVSGVLMTLPLSQPPVNAHFTPAFFYGALLAPLVVSVVLTLTHLRAQTTEFVSWRPGRTPR